MITGSLAETFQQVPVKIFRLKAAGIVLAANNPVQFSSQAIDWFITLLCFFNIARSLSDFMGTPLWL